MFGRKRMFAGAATAALMILGVAAIAQDAPPAGQPGQQPGRPGAQARRAGRQVSLATIPAEMLQKLVNLTPEQVKTIKGIQDKYQTDARALRPQRGAQLDADARTANRQKLTELNRTTNQDIQNVLKPEQKEKLRTVVRELTPLVSAGIPIAVIPDLKLTEEQKKQIGQITKDTQEQLRGLSQDDRRAKSRELMQATRDKVQALLTQEQKDKIKAFQETRRNRANRRNQTP